MATSAMVSCTSDRFWISNVPDDVQKMDALADDLYAEVFDVGGTISGEHGDGLSRTPFVRQQYGPLYDVFREVKQIFDPLNIFNPGKDCCMTTATSVASCNRCRRPTTELAPPRRDEVLRQHVGNGSPPTAAARTAALELDAAATL